MSTNLNKYSAEEALNAVMNQGTEGEETLRTVSGAIRGTYDYIGIAYPNGTTETYTYKNGGSGGTTVATVTVVYTSSAKTSISSVTYVNS